MKHMLGFLRDMEIQQENSPSNEKDDLVEFSVLLDNSGARSLTTLAGSYERLREADSGTLNEYRNMFIKAYNFNAGKISRIFSTDSNYIGRSNLNIRQGDVIAVLFGSDLPVVLRKHESCYEFIGGCYVSGLMYGEIMDNARNDSTIERILLI